MAKQFYVPDTEAKKVIWLNNLSQKLSEPGSPGTTRGEDLGLSATEVSQTDADAAMYDFCISNQENFKGEKQERTNYKNLAATGQEGVPMDPYPVSTPVSPPEAVPQGIFKRVTELVGRIKKDADYTTAIGEDLRIIGDEDTFDPATFKPGLTVENTQQGRLLKFEKENTDGVNVYGREKGQTVWSLLARDNFSPYLDARIFSQPTALEYKVTSVIQDEEIGVDSDIVEITTEG